MASAPEWLKFPFIAGQYPDAAPSEGENHWRTGSWIRFVLLAGTAMAALQVIGGWEKVTSDPTVEGKVRKIYQYSTNAGYPKAAIATHTSTWSFSDGVLYYTTPIVSYGTLSNPFSTTLNDATVVVAHTAHGRATGDAVNFPESPVVTGSGLTIYSGHYAITKIDADNYSIEAVDANGDPALATASTSGVGGTVDYEYFLAIGNEYGLGGAGFGTGLMGAGLYGRASSVLVAARTGTFGQLGQNIFYAPRDGGVYESSPYFTATELAELVSNGTFTGSAAGWTLGAGWAYGANNAAATLSDAALSQDIAVSAGTWNILKFNVTRAAGTVQPSLDGISAGSTINAAGRYFLRIWGGDGGTQTLAFTGTGFTGTIDNVSCKILGTFAPVTNAPTEVTGVLVTPQGHVETWGGVPYGESAFDPMLLKRSDAFAPQSWQISTSGSEAGEDFLTGGSRIVTGVVGGDRVYYLTDAVLWERTYRGTPTLTYSSQSKGDKCGCIGINAACYADGRLWWMGNNKTFWVYDGTQPQPLVCPGTRWVFDNIQPNQRDLIQCWHNSENKEVWFQWSDKRDQTNEISRYAAYNYVGDFWIFGQRVFTAVGDGGAYGFPIGADASSNLYFLEKTDSADGAALDWYARSGAFDIGDGNTIHEISGFIPDTQNQAGSYTIRFYGYEMNQNSTPYDTGQITIGPMTTIDQSFFVSGRQTEIELRGNSAPQQLRWGTPRFLVQDTGDQF